MPMRRILHKYIFLEIWPTFLATLFIFVFVVLATKMLSITEIIVTRGGHVGQLLKMVLYLLPDIITFSLPAASLMAVVVGFLRLSADNEIIAMKSSGISLYQMLPPVFAFSGLGLLLAAVTSAIAVPWGTTAFKDLVFQIAESRADLGIKEHVFSEPFDRVVFYVNSFSPRQRTMKDIFVVDRRDRTARNTIVAKQARIFPHPNEKVITIRFRDGTIFVDEKALQKRRTIHFKTYDLNIGLRDVLSALQSRHRGPKEMSVNELIRHLRSTPKGEVRYNHMIIELSEKFSIPLAVFLMGIIGAPLGAQIRARGRSTGIGVSLFVFLIYYMCLAAVRSISETGILPPVIGVWIPNFFLVGACFYLFWSAANERRITLLPHTRFRSKKP